MCYFDHPRQFDEHAEPLIRAIAQLAAPVFVRFELEQRLRKAAMLDELTGLPNRRLMEEEAQSPRSPDRGLTAVFFIDLDGFKAVNDELGHDEGDRVLIQVAERLRAVIRPEDLAARYGGDEFLVICHTVTVDSASDIAARLCESLRLPYNHLPAYLSVSASVGVVIADPGLHAQQPQTADPDCRRRHVHR